jgi:Family of unknown function (DUF5329)
MLDLPFKRSTSARGNAHNRINCVKLCAGFLSVFAFLLFSTQQILAEEPLDATISYLLDYVAKSEATFVRNGQTHTPQEAVNHIKAKYEHFKTEIKTPEDFIRLSASKSLLTGQPYLVRTKDGKEMRLDAWLTEALRKHRGQ